LALASNAAQPDFWIGYSANYNQVGDNKPTPEAEHPYYVYGECNIDSGKIINAKLITPSGSEKSFAKEDFRNASFHYDYVDLKSLILDFPTGNYTLIVQTDSGKLTKTTKFYAPEFPTAPRVNTGNNAIWLNNYFCVVDGTKSCTISWAPPDQPIDNIDIQLADYKYKEFYSKNISKNSTSFAIPLSALNSMPEEKIYATISFNSDSKINAAIRTTVDFYKQIITTPFQFIITHSFIQSNNSTISEHGGKSSIFYYDYGPYNVIIYGGRGGIVNGPNKTTFSLTPGSPVGAAYNSGPIQNKSELNKKFPEGTYSIGKQSATLTGYAFPNAGSPIKITSVNGKTPRWSNGKLILNPKIKNIISWTPFNITPDKFKTNGEIFFELRTASTSRLIYKESGAISTDKKAFNSYTIPANKLTSNMEALMQIKYFLASSFNLKTNSVGAYSMATYVWLSAE
jgi:hypothetical protein